MENKKYCLLFKNWKHYKDSELIGTYDNYIEAFNAAKPIIINKLKNPDIESTMDFYGAFLNVIELIGYDSIDDYFNDLIAGKPYRYIAKKYWQCYIKDNVWNFRCINAVLYMEFIVVENKYTLNE